MRKSITMLMAMLVAVGMLASFAGPVAADHGDSYDAEAENDAEIDNDIEQEQELEQNSEQNGAAIAFNGDAEVDQENEQNAEQTQVAVNDNDVEQDAIAAAFSVF